MFAFQDCSHFPKKCSCFERMFRNSKNVWIFRRYLRYSKILKPQTNPRCMIPNSRRGEERNGLKTEKLEDQRQQSSRHFCAVGKPKTILRPTVYTMFPSTLLIAAYMDTYIHTYIHTYIDLTIKRGHSSVDVAAPSPWASSSSCAPRASSPATSPCRSAPR